MLKEIDTILFYEHVSRELPFLMVLKLELEKQGVSSVIVPIHFNRYLNSLKYKPKLVVLPYLYSKQNKTYLNFLNSFQNVKCLNLHHEQFYSDETKEHLLPSDEYSKDIYHLSWSKAFAQDMIDVGVKKENILTIGNPRSDTFFLSPKPYIANLKNKYKKIIFIPTTFSWALVDEEYFLKIDGFDKKTFAITKDTTYKTAQRYFQDFYKLSLELKDYLFILRPHPFEDIQTFIDLFLESTDLKIIPKNILISREYDVYEWLKISDLTIGWCTTVNMEASLFNKANIIYHPVDYPKHMELGFFKYYTIIDSFDKLRANIMNIKYAPTTEYDNFIKENFGIADGKINKKLAKDIKDIVKSTTKVQIKLSIYKNILKTFKVDIIKNILLKFNLLHKLNKEYTGLLEDNLSENKLNTIYMKFIHEYKN